MYTPLLYTIYASNTLIMQALQNKLLKDYVIYIYKYIYIYIYIYIHYILFI